MSNHDTSFCTELVPEAPKSLVETEELTLNVESRHKFLYGIGARGGTRTRTPFQASGFKPLASAIPPLGHIGVVNEFTTSKYISALHLKMFERDNYKTHTVSCSWSVIPHDKQLTQ
jgi:hypothetical protein